MSANFNIFIKSARGGLRCKNSAIKNNIVNYYDAYIKKNNKKFIFDLGTTNNNEIEGFKSCLYASFNTVNNKEFVNNNPALIRECFEIGCYILYDRQILDEVIEKQKHYDTDYVADFLKYVLRIFLKRYDKNFVLTKNQCQDIKKLCLKLLSVNSFYKECNLIYKISAKDIVDMLKGIAI